MPLQDIAQELRALLPFSLAFLGVALLSYCVSRLVGRRPVTVRCRAIRIADLAPSRSMFRIRVGGRHG